MSSDGGVPSRPDGRVPTDARGTPTYDGAMADHSAPVDGSRADAGPPPQDSGHQMDAAVDSPLPDACAGLLACCSFVAQVDLPQCDAFVRGRNAGQCAALLGDYVSEGELDGGPCLGMGSGTPACVTLAPCCTFAHGADNCEQVVEAGIQSACDDTYNALRNMQDCP
jgi:hypothetical protein